MHKFTVALLLSLLLTSPMYARRDDDDFIRRDLFKLLKKIARVIMPQDEGPLITPPIP